MKIWNDGEVNALFKEVETCKNKNISLKVAFENHAQKFKRKANSVRNYYYKEVDNLLEDSARLNRLGINLSLHKKNHFECFEKEEEKNVMSQIEKLTNSGMSVRSACHKLSEGNLTQMTRLQNKYQNMKKSNVIPFRQSRKLLSDSEINSLFLGLVRLIKKNAVEEHVEKNKDGEYQTAIMKKAFNELNQKDEEILILKQESALLRKENQELLTKLKSLEKKNSLKQHLKSGHISKMLEN